MPTPFFADLVRELCQEGGTGPLTLTGAVPGHRRFVDAVPADTSFHYAIAGIAQADQWEVGAGRIGAGGQLLRDMVMSSSNDGEAVDFAAGLKTVALTVGAEWFAATDTQGAALAGAVAGFDADLAGLADAVDARQPVSTIHDAVSAGEPTDLVTLRRGAGWVNIPLAAMAFRGADGRFALDGRLASSDGSAAAPSIGFAGDADTGLWRPAANVLGFAAGGVERARIASSGLELTMPNGGKLFAEQAGIASVQLRSSSTLRFDVAAASSHQFYVDGASVVAIGPIHLTPGSDNNRTLGSSSLRWSVAYAGTGTINTSDARDKMWRGTPSEGELRAARRIVGDLGFYQWNDAIAAKGADGARLHFGVRAQAVWAIMADEGLIDPIDADGRPGATPYAFLCWDQWMDAASGAAADRFGVRPDQLALFLIAAQEQRLAALEMAA